MGGGGGVEGELVQEAALFIVWYSLIKTVTHSINKITLKVDTTCNRWSRSYTVHCSNLYSVCVRSHQSSESGACRRFISCHCTRAALQSDTVADHRAPSITCWLHPLHSDGSVRQQRELQLQWFSWGYRGRRLWY